MLTPGNTIFYLDQTLCLEGQMVGWMVGRMVGWMVG